MSADIAASPPTAVPFISYSRKDLPFVRRLHDALAAMGRDIWVDWEDIPPSVDWLERIRNAIVETDAFVFLVSPASAASEVCRTEATLAEGAGKRLIPVVIEPVRAAETPMPIRSRNWFTFDPADFDGSLARLLEVVDADYDWLELHTRLGVRAAEWIASGRKGHLALSGPALAEAERWLGEAPRHRDPTVTSDQTELIIGSRRRATRRLRYLSGVLAGVLATIGVLGLVAFIQYQTAEAQRREGSGSAPGGCRPAAGRDGSPARCAGRITRRPVRPRAPPRGRRLPPIGSARCLREPPAHGDSETAHRDVPAPRSRPRCLQRRVHAGQHDDRHGVDRWVVVPLGPCDWDPDVGAGTRGWRALRRVRGRRAVARFRWRGRTRAVLGGG